MTNAAIIFDCDGVLVDSEIIYNTVERELLSEIGLHYSTREYQQRFLGLVESDFLDQLSRDYQQLHQGAFPPDFIHRVKQECIKRFQTELVAIEGSRVLLEQVQLPVGIASSSSLDILDKKLRMTNLYDYFTPHIYSGEQVKNGKPSADIFLFSAQKMGLQPAQCLVIEDSVNGVLAGIAAGMDVWGFTGGSHSTDHLRTQLLDAGASRVFASYSALQSTLL